MPGKARQGKAEVTTKTPDVYQRWVEAGCVSGESAAALTIGTHAVTFCAAPVAHAQVVTLTSGFVRITSEGIQPGGLIVWWPQ